MVVFIILLIISGIAPYQQAFEYEKLGEYEKAITFYKKAHPVLLDNNLYRGGKCLMNLERFECAVHYFNRLVNESKDSPYYNHAIENLAICYEKLHDYENAITIWKRKIDARSLYRIAKNYEKLGINQDTMYIRIAKEFPKSEFALLSLKKVPADSNNIRRKVQYSHHLYEDIIKTMSQDEFTARTLFKLGRFKDAKVRFKKLGFKYMTALCDEKLGNPGQAINGYKKAGTPKALLIAGMLCEKINKKSKQLSFTSLFHLPRDIMPALI